MFIYYKTIYRNSDNGFDGSFPLTNMSPLSKFDEVLKRPQSKSLADNHEHSIVILYFVVYSKENCHNRRPFSPHRSVFKNVRLNSFRSSSTCII